MMLGTYKKAIESNKKGKTRFPTGVYELTSLEKMEALYALIQ